MIRVLFMGTPGLAATVLRSLVEAGDLHVIAVVTRPDQPRGRGLKLLPSPVKEFAANTGLPVLQPQSARDPAFIETLRELAPDIIVVAAYGQILPQSILDLPRFGCLNVHTSLLPKYRGAAPVQHAILNGEPETGVTIMKMNAGLDTGDILTQQQTPILDTDNSGTLLDRLAVIGSELLVKTIPGYVEKKIQPRSQASELASHAPKIRKSDGLLDWTVPATAVWNRVRAMIPWPGAFSYLHTGPTPMLMKIWEAKPADGAGAAGEILRADREGIIVACGTGALRILVVQREGGRRLTVEQFIAGNAVRPGDMLRAG